MKIQELFEEGNPNNPGRAVLSFEVFPPKRDLPIESVYGQLSSLCALKPDPTMEADTTTVTFAGEAITDKEGTIIGFEDPQESRSDADRAARRAKVITAAAVGVVGLTSAAFVYLKLRRRP